MSNVSSCPIRRPEEPISAFMLWVHAGVWQQRELCAEWEDGDGAGLRVRFT